MDLAGAVHEAAKRELAAEVISQYGEVRLKVNGASMLPSVWPGDVLTVHRREVAELGTGRIVLFHRDRGLVAHRVVGKRGDDLITRGDSLSCDDPPVRCDEVLGEVVSIHRNDRSVPLSPVWWHSACSYVVRRSELCTRILLRLGRLQRQSWANQ